MSEGATASYPWYRSVHDDSLEQGDILLGFNILRILENAPDGVDSLQAELETLDVIVLTQTCDIEHGKARSLVLCPVVSLRMFVNQAVGRKENHWESSKHLEALRQGNLPGYHLISDAVFGQFTFPVSIVDFHEIYSASTSQVKSFVSLGQFRLRICPPYKEHLAQAFARFFMRVGLPENISREKLKLK